MPAAESLLPLGGFCLPVEAVEGPIKHFLVPVHYLLSKEQAAELLRKYNLVLDQLPKVSASDPAILYLAPKRNDLVKIVRDSPTAGKTIYYRRVW